MIAWTGKTLQREILEHAFRKKFFCFPAAISDCLLIGFIRATETVTKNLETTNSRLQLTQIAQYKYSKDSKKINDRSGALEKR